MKNTNTKKWDEFRLLCSEILVPRIARALEGRLDATDELLDAIGRKLVRIEAALGTEGEADIL